MCDFQWSSDPIHKHSAIALQNSGTVAFGQGNSDPRGYEVVRSVDSFTSLTSKRNYRLKVLAPNGTSVIGISTTGWVTNSTALSPGNSLNPSPPNDPDAGWIYHPSNGRIQDSHAITVQTGMPAYGIGDTVSVTVDNGMFQFKKNGSLVGSPIALFDYKEYHLMALDTTFSTVGGLHVEILGPTLELIGDAEVILECGDEYTELGAESSVDVCDVYVTVGGDVVDTSVAGTYTVTYEGIDDVGNVVEGISRTVIVQDTTPPVITLVGASEVTLECPEPYVEQGATAFDECDGDLYVAIGGSVDSGIPGVYEVTYDATDATGNAAYQVVRTVTVQDTTPPVITLVGASEVTLECPEPYVEQGATAFDECDGDLYVAIGGSVDSGTPGVYEVTYDATDASGNSAYTLVRTVTVQDTTAPVIALVGAWEVTLECPEPYVEQGATAFDECDGDLYVTIGGSVISGTPGVYEVTYDATDASGNSAYTLVRTVTVQDTTPPVITLVGASEVTLECPEPYVEQGATAFDECDGDLYVAIGGSVDSGTPGVYEVTYDATDATGNAAYTLVRTVTVQDTTPPVITLVGASEVTLECPEPYVEQGATAFDECDGDLYVTIGGSVNHETPGVYEVTYDATDASGNSAYQVVRTVTVQDTTPPVISLVGASEVTLECPEPYVEQGATAFDECDGDLYVAIGGTVDSGTPGVYEVTYDVTDASGNSAYQVVRTVTVQDTTPPVITLVGASEVTLECPEPYVEQGATAFDACDGDLYVTIGGSVISGTPGVYEVTYDASDATGNAAYQVVRTVTVQDTTPPVITLVGASEVTLECPEPYVEQGATASDACDGELYVTISGSVDSGTLGVYEVTYDASDATGNAAYTVVRTVTVQDTTPAVITLVGASEVTLECPDPYVEQGATAFDECDGDLYVTISGSVDSGTPGVYEVTYDASDATGNAAYQVVRTVTVQDTTPPVITLVGASEVTLECPEPYVEQGATAFDACDGDLYVTIGGSVASGTPGVYEVTYDASDASGNSAYTLVRTVTVKDTIPPTITLFGAEEVTLDCGEPYVEYGATAFDACDGAVNVVIGGDAVDTGIPGEYVVTYDATDASSNSASQVSRTVVVLDNYGLSTFKLVGPEHVTLRCQELYQELGAVAFDCENSFEVEVGGDVVNPSVPGTYTVTYSFLESPYHPVRVLTRTVTVLDGCIKFKRFRVTIVA